MTRTTSPGFGARAGHAPAPDFPVEPWETLEHGVRRTDEYHWLQNPADPRVRACLEANNRHAESALRHAAPLRERLVAELWRLTPPDEGQAPWQLGRHWYRTRWLKSQDYPEFVRRHGSPSGPEEVLLDGNALARGHAFFALEGIQVSPGQDRLAFATDTVGNRLFTIQFKDLATGRWLPDRLTDVEPVAAWASDSRTVVYVKPDPGTLRPGRVLCHRLGTDPAGDRLIYEEPDPAFRCAVALTRSQAFILVHCFSADVEEIRALPASDPGGALRVLCPRSAGCACEADHAAGRFYLRTNHGAPDFRICSAPDAPDAPVGPGAWRAVAGTRPGVYIERLAAFRRHLVLVEHCDGRQRARILDRESGAEHVVPFPDPAGHVWLDANPTTETDVIRLGYTSLVTPVSFYDYDLVRRRLTLVQRESVEGYDPAAFETVRIRAPARDGASIPVTLVYRRDTPARGPAPALLFGYGAYGNAMPVTFDQARLVLLNRGFLYAHVHVRGGADLGDAWYQGGRLLRKPNSAFDLIDAAEHLAAAGLARRDAICAETLSAGGLMLGAAINQRPDLFRGVVAREPFVDLLNTMADPALPLTACEYGEWGDPSNPDHWACMRSYSPYDTIAAAAYPHVLATAALHDSQVPYWEPAKWVARLRAHAAGPARILLRTALSAGHGGMSGRFHRLRDQAFAFTFLLDAVGIRD